MVAILDRQVKQRRESADAFRSGGRGDRANDEEAEAVILREFLPEPLAPDELETMARAAIAETGASSPSEMGKVMGRLTPQTKGRADGREVSELVRRLLSEGSGA
jgi:hypothetical protein